MLNDIAEAAVNVNGGAKKVDRDHVISLLGEIYIALEVLLKNLKVIVKADVVLRGSVQVLAGIVAGLLLVRVLYVLWPVLMVAFWLGCYRSHQARSWYRWFRRCHRYC